MKLSLVLLIMTPLTEVMASPSSSVLHFCNRGYCYTKKEPLDMHGASRQASRFSGGINFCTDSGGHVRDCELFEILGSDAEMESEAVECGSNGCKRMQDEAKESAKRYSSREGEVIETLDLDENASTHVSWKERPKRGRCYDQGLHYEFDCNLVEILNEGLVLIEDLRAGGTFAAQPKSDFSTRKCKNPPSTPEIVIGSDIDNDTFPNEDFRTNVVLNLEGI